MLCIAINAYQLHTVSLQTIQCLATIHSILPLYTVNTVKPAIVECGHSEIRTPL